ncbi:MAG: phage terminase small subunit P27 family [Clostridium sp.]|nr:phage terminase small subunit P27 family [Clostridium sp.]
MAGRQKIPASIIEMRGKSHLSKEEIRKRKEEEIKVDSDKVKAPSYLPPDLKREFNKIAKDLLEVGLITNLDVDTLARYVQSKKLYLELTNKLLENPNIMIEEKDILIQQDKLFKQCRQTATDLGLTITSRCKIVLPKTKEEKKKPQNESEALFGNII